MVVLGGMAVSYERGTPVALRETSGQMLTRARASRYKIGDEEMALPGASIADGAVCRIAIRDST